jgi:plastocyanin
MLLTNRSLPPYPRAARACLLAAALPLVVACSAPAASSTNPAPVEGAQQLVIRGHDTMRFDPAAPVVEAGKPVQVHFENEGQLVHDVSLDEGLTAGGGVKVVAAAKARSFSRTFAFERPGVYRFICSQPGHEAAGMHGTITVR